MNFGALNRQGGQRRLNVAITRARQGLHVLKDFLVFARSGQLHLNYVDQKNSRLKKNLYSTYRISFKKKVGAWTPE